MNHFPISSHDIKIIRNYMLKFPEGCSKDGLCSLIADLTIKDGWYIIQYLKIKGFITEDLKWKD